MTYDDNVLSFPDFYFKLQLDIELVPDFFPYQINQPDNILAGAALAGDNKVGVLFADYSSAYLQAFESGAVNHSASRKSPRVFEYTAGINSV